MSQPDRIGIRNGPYVRGPEVRENARTGSQTVWFIEGSEAECRAQQLFYRASGAAETNLRPMGTGNWELMVAFPWGENGQAGDPPTDVHELESNQIQESIYQNPLIRINISSDNLYITADIIQRYLGREFTDTKDSNGIVTITAVARARQEVLNQTGADWELCTALFNQAALLHMDSYMDWHQVYRRTITGASPQAIIASYVGVGQVWTSAEVAAFENIPGGYYFSLPANYVWLKTKPTVIASARQKTQITYSYIEGTAFSMLAYTARGNAVVHDFLWYAS